MSILEVTKNFEVHPSPNSTLYRPEIDVILAVIHRTAANRLSSLKGTFILDGQPHNHPASCICRFNLVDGACRRKFFCGAAGNSDELAAEAINQLLNAGSERTRYRNIWPHDFYNASGSMCVGGGIHCDGNLNVLVLNSTYGKFMATSYLDCESEYDFDGNIAVLVAVATAFSEMMREDRTLQRSFAKIRQVYDHHYIQIVQDVQGLSTQAQLPELRNWRAWRRPTNQTGNSYLPFEEHFSLQKDEPKAGFSDPPERDPDDRNDPSAGDHNNPPAGHDNLPHSSPPLLNPQKLPDHPSPHPEE